MFSQYLNVPLTYSINDNGPRERGTDDAGDGADGVGYAHQDGRVLGSHVKVIHTKPGPSETAKPQGQGEEGGGGAAGHDEGRQGHEERLSKVS